MPTSQATPAAAPVLGPVALPLPETLNPDHLDVLSELAQLLTRLRTLPTNANANHNNSSNNNSNAGNNNAGTGTGTGPASSQQQPQHQATGPGGIGTPTPTAILSSIAAANNKRTGELTLKEVPAATDALRHRFQRARNIIKTTLPDLERDIPAQEVEIAALEARIARQRETLAKLREVGARLGVSLPGDGEGQPMEE
jgi:hypothetical protein